VLKKEGLGEGRLLDLTKDGKNFYLQEMKKFFKNPSDYLEAAKLYQDRNNPNRLLLEFLQSQEDK
jgi:hypothetical protein